MRTNDACIKAIDAVSKYALCRSRWEGAGWKDKYETQCGDLKDADRAVDVWRAAEQACPQNTDDIQMTHTQPHYTHLHAHTCTHLSQTSTHTHTHN